MTTITSGGAITFWQGPPPSDALREAVASVIASQEDGAPSLVQADLVLFEFNARREEIDGLPVVATLTANDARFVYFTLQAQKGDSWENIRARHKPGIIIDSPQATRPAASKRKKASKQAAVPYRKSDQERLEREIANRNREAAEAASEAAWKAGHEQRKQLAAEADAKKGAAKNAVAEILANRASRVDRIRSKATEDLGSNNSAINDRSFDEKEAHQSLVALNNLRLQDQAELDQIANFSNEVAEEIRRILKGSETAFRELRAEYARKWKINAQVPDANALALSDTNGLILINCLRDPDLKTDHGTNDHLWNQHVIESNTYMEDLIIAEGSPPFPRELVDAIKNNLGMVTNDGQIKTLHFEYASIRHRYAPHFPEIESLTAKDAEGVFAIGNYDTENNESWSEHCARQSRYNEAFWNTNNPWMPSWISKTSERLNPWVTATGIAEEDRQGREAFDKLFKASIPVDLNKCAGDLIGISPADDASMSFLADAIDRVLPIIASQLGAPGDLPPILRTGCLENRRDVCH